MTVRNDTVENAKATPDQEQPWEELSLKEDEYQRIREILSRRPSDAELTVYSVMWSEHCSYKSSKTHLRYFGQTATEEMNSKILAGIGENAGVVDRTQVVGVLGVIEDVHSAIGHDLGTVDEPEVLVVLGETKDEFGGSIWQQVSGGGLSGLPPQVDLANEAKLAEFFGGNTSLTAAHDLSEGGLSQAVIEMLIRSGKGVELTLDEVHEDVFTALFSESASRVIVATTADRQDEVLARAAELGTPATVIGTTDDSATLSVGDTVVAVEELAQAWSATLPDLFDHAVGANAVVE